MARKKANSQLTPLEMDIMSVLWESGPATVQMVMERMSRNRDLAYTTVQTMLNVLNKKGKVNRIQVEGERALRYEASLSQPSAMRQLLGDVITRVFGGSAERMVLSMVESKMLTPDKLDSLNRLVAESKRKTKEKGDGNG